MMTGEGDQGKLVFAFQWLHKFFGTAPSGYLIGSNSDCFPEAAISRT